LLWTFSTGDAADSSPVICGDKVLTASNDGKLYMLTASAGKVVWSFDTASPIPSGPAIANNHILITCDDGSVYAFTATQ